MEWQHAITAALTALVLGAFAHLAMRAADLQGETLLLRYPRMMRWFLWFSMLFFVAMGSDAARPLLAGTATDKDVRTFWVALPMTLLFTLGCLGELRVALRVDRDGIGGQTAWRGQRRIAWRDVVAVKWSRRNRWFVLTDRHGEKLRVPTMLQGHAAVIDALRAHVPELAWREAVAAWLQSRSA